MKIGFVHITKTGGNAIEKLIRKSYADEFARPSFGHTHTNMNYQHSFAIVRDPVERFLSSYFYWKNGAKDSEWKRNSNWNPKSKSLEEFIYLWDQKDAEFFRQLNSEITTFQWHFAPQKKWLDDRAYNRTIILKYSNDLDVQFTKLLEFLGINKKENLPKVNVTKDKDEEIDLEFVTKWVSKTFEIDLKLFDDIEQNKFMRII